MTIRRVSFNLGFIARGIETRYQSAIRKDQS